MIASISLIAMLVGTLAGLLAYARSGQRSWKSKLIANVVGTGHFTLHVCAMFTLSLSVVMLNTWITPPLERAINGMYESRREQNPIVQDVIEESLKPLQRRAEEQEWSALSNAGRPKPIREIVGFINYPLSMILGGMFLGGSIWGLYLTLTSFLGRTFAQSPFAMLGTRGFRCFLRLRLERSQLTMYAIGLRRTSMTWAQAAGYPPSAGFIPETLRPQLIEPPIIIKNRKPLDGERPQT
jgi:hypothetical protein